MGGAGQRVAESHTLPGNRRRGVRDDVVKEGWSVGEHRQPEATVWAAGVDRLPPTTARSGWRRTVAERRAR